MISDFELNTSSLIFSNITSSKAAMCEYSVALLCGLEITFSYFFDICNSTVITSTGWLKIKYPTGEYAISLQSVV